MDELKAKELLGEASEAMMEASKNTKAPIADVIYSSNLEQENGIEITALFDEMEYLYALEENHLKDQLMEVFIKYLTSHDYPFGDSPKLKFQFHINL